MDWSRSLDSYITGGRYHKEEVSFVCPSCGDTKDLVVEVEYGQYDLPDAAFCEKCQQEMES